jgi:hypothetical protein
MKGPMGRIPTYQSLEGLDRTSSPRGFPHPLPRRHLSPGIHPTQTLLPGATHEHAPATGTRHGECPDHTPPARLVSTTRRRSCLVDTTLTTHTHNSRQDLPSYYQVLLSQNIIILSAPRALATHKQSSTKHHIISIMRSRSSMRATSNHISASLAYQRVCRRVVATR